MFLWKALLYCFSKKSQESCFSGTPGNSGGDGEANYISRGSGRGKTAGDLGERVPRVPRGIPNYNISLFLNRKSWVPGPIPGRKCTGLLSTEFRLCVYQEDPSQHHHYFQARNIHVWRQIIFGLVRGFFCPCYQSVVYKLRWQVDSFVLQGISSRLLRTPY